MAEVRFGEALGRGLRDRREELGQTQDEVARYIRAAGLDWTRSVVGAIESGRRELSVPELAVVLAALDASLADVLRDAGELLLTDGPDPAAVGANDLVAGLAGRAKLGEVIGSSSTSVRRVARALAEMRDADQRIWPGSTIADRIRAERTMGEAEAKAGRRLGADARAVSLAAHRLWGRSLTEERDARVADASPPDAPSRTIQALRGHVTRALLEELQPLLTRRGRKS